MLKLPKRETEIPVDVADGVKLVMKPLTDEEYWILNEGAEVEESAVRFRLSKLPGLFEAKLLRVEGDVEAEEGGPIDVANSEHVARIPQSWRGVALIKLVRHATGLTLGEVGNSRGRRPRSPRAEATSSRA